MRLSCEAETAQVRRRAAALARRSRGKREPVRHGRAERLGPSVLGRCSAAPRSMIQRELALGLVAGGAPGRDAVTAQNHADGVGVLRLHGGDSSRAGSRAGATGSQTTRSPKISLVSCSPSATVATAIPLSGCRWSTWAALTSPCIARVDGDGPRAPPVQAEVEGRHHLVLALDARVDVDEGKQPVKPQDSETALPQGAQVTPEPFDPDQLDRAHRGTGSTSVPLAGGVSAGVVDVPADRTRQAVRRGRCSSATTVFHCQAFQPDGRPPMRSACDLLGNHWPDRPAWGRRQNRVPRATQRGRDERRCRRRP